MIKWLDKMMDKKDYDFGDILLAVQIGGAINSFIILIVVLIKKLLLLV